VASRTPIWLSADLQHAAAQGAPPVVLNVGAPMPPSLGGLTRLIEIVSDDAEEADSGRSRWRAYKAAGLQIKHHHGGPVSAG
jgi:DNA polymerase-3 subunit chi